MKTTDTSTICDQEDSPGEAFASASAPNIFHIPSSIHIYSAAVRRTSNLASQPQRALKPPLPPAPPTSLILHPNRRVRRLGEILLHTRFPARRIGPLSRMPARARLTLLATHSSAPFFLLTTHTYPNTSNAHSSLLHS